MSNNLDFKTLAEWLKIFPPTTYLYIKSFAQSYYWGKQEILLETLPPELLRSYVCNLEEDFDCDLFLDVACSVLEACSDKKDKIISDLWKKLYLTADNSERMSRIFEEYKEEYGR